jgi:hypothetical protein
VTLEPRLHKERVDFSHNYTLIRIKCPECLRTIKGGNHVKVFKNLAGLWRHIKLEHGEISNCKFNTSQIKEVLKHIALAIEWGMIADTTSGTKSAPTGTLSWSASVSGGSFSSGTCTLSATSSSQSSCQVTYTTQSTTGSVTITAKYLGDSTHKNSSGKSALTVT